MFFPLVTPRGRYRLERVERCSLHGEEPGEERDLFEACSKTLPEGGSEVGDKEKKLRKREWLFEQLVL